MAKEKGETLGIRISAEDKRKLEQYAALQRRSISDQIVYWLDQALNELQNKY
jgi:uncharacterized protein (DUF1778 family)